MPAPSGAYGQAKGPEHPDYPRHADGTIMTHDLDGRELPRNLNDIDESYRLYDPMNPPRPWVHLQLMHRQTEERRDILRCMERFEQQKRVCFLVEGDDPRTHAEMPIMSTWSASLRKDLYNNRHVSRVWDKPHLYTMHDMFNASQQSEQH